jgi:CobQ-like glutamine amidotransferase family enzyme
VKARAALEQAKELGRVNEGKGMGAGDPKEGLYTKTTQCIIFY